VVRATVAATIMAAIVGELVRTYPTDGRPLLDHVANYFSYFTTMSNALAAITLGIGAWYAFRSLVDPAWYNFALASVVTYVTTTGAVYNVALRSASTDQDGWANEVLHVFAMVFLIGAWLVMPGKRVLRWNRVWPIAAFPACWLAYTMIRGSIVGWYPYTFLDPQQPGGYASVTGYVMLIASFILAVAVAAVAVSRVQPSLTGIRSLTERIVLRPAVAEEPLTVPATPRPAPGSGSGRRSPGRPLLRRLAARSPSASIGYHRSRRALRGERHRVRSRAPVARAARPRTASTAPCGTVHRTQMYRGRVPHPR